MIVDELEGLPLELAIDYDHVLLSKRPLVVPQDARDAVPILELLKLGVKGLPFELYEHAVPLLQAVELVLPNLQLLRHRCQALLLAQVKQVADIDGLELFEVASIDIGSFSVPERLDFLLLCLVVVLLLNQSALLRGHRLVLPTHWVGVSLQEVHHLRRRDLLFEGFFEALARQHANN